MSIINSIFILGIIGRLFSQEKIYEDIGETILTENYKSTALKI